MKPGSPVISSPQKAEAWTALQVSVSACTLRPIGLQLLTGTHVRRSVRTQSASAWQRHQS